MKTSLWPWIVVLCLVSAGFAGENHKQIFKIPVLCYHAVSSTASGPFSLTPETFESQMELLQREGYTVVSVNGLIAFLRSVQRGEKVFLPLKPVVITFDDNYESIRKCAYSILEKYQYRSCNFIYTKDVSEVGWAQLRKFEGSLMEMHSHTISHADLVKRQADENEQTWRRRIFAEIAGSRKLLGEKLGRAPAYIAYPYGRWNKDVIRMMRIAGYVAGFSAFGGYVQETSSLDVLPRFTIFRRYDLDMFRKIVSGEWNGSQDEPDFVQARDYNRPDE